MKKNSGFTLVELMIVIAIIGLLAVVLVPKIAASKDAAKEAGVKKNMQYVRTLILPVSDQYYVWSPTNQPNYYNLIVSELNKNANNPSNAVINPFTGSTQIAYGPGLTDVTVAPAVRIFNYGASNRSANYYWYFNNIINPAAADIKLRMQGTVFVAFYSDDSTLDPRILRVTIHGFDRNGNFLNTVNNSLHLPE